MRVEVLEGEALGELVSTQGPFHGQQAVVDQLGNAQVVVVRADNGAIVAHWPIWVAIHLEPLWIDPEARKNPAVVRALVSAMQWQLVKERITTAFAVIGHADLVENLPLAARIGFERVPGDLFFVRSVVPAAEGAEDGAVNGSGSNPGNLPRRAVLHEPGAEQAEPADASERDDGPPRLCG